jgi:hypothetical protein
MALQYDVDWETVKKEYKKLVTEHKPKELKELKLFNLSIATFERHTGLSGSLKNTCAYANKSVGNKVNGENYHHFLSLMTNFNKEADTYLALLKKSIDAETPIKGDKYRGLKMLQAKLGSYKVGFEAEVQKIKDAWFKEDMMGQAVNQAKGGLEKAIAGFKASRQVIKAGPTVAVYDREFDPSGGSAGRNLTTALQRFVTGKTTQADLAKTHITALAPWATGAKLALPATTNAAGVLQALEQVTAEVKACANAFVIAF